jgi:hypothetical protein
MKVDSEGLRIGDLKAQLLDKVRAKRVSVSLAPGEVLPPTPTSALPPLSADTLAQYALALVDEASAMNATTPSVPRLAAASLLLSDSLPLSSLRERFAGAPNNMWRLSLEPLRPKEDEDGMDGAQGKANGSGSNGGGALVIEGYLNKRATSTRLTGSFQRRWFRLTTTRLSYWDTEEQAKGTKQQPPQPAKGSFRVSAFHEAVAAPQSPAMVAASPSSAAILAPGVGASERVGRTTRQSVITANLDSTRVRLGPWGSHVFILSFPGRALELQADSKESFNAWLAAFFGDKYKSKLALASSSSSSPAAGPTVPPASANSAGLATAAAASNAGVAAPASSTSRRPRGESHSSDMRGANSSRNKGGAGGGGGRHERFHSVDDPSQQQHSRSRSRERSLSPGAVLRGDYAQGISAHNTPYVAPKPAPPLHAHDDEDSDSDGAWGSQQLDIADWALPPSVATTAAGAEERSWARSAATAASVRAVNQQQQQQQPPPPRRKPSDEDLMPGSFMPSTSNTPESSLKRPVTQGGSGSEGEDDSEADDEDEHEEPPPVHQSHLAVPTPVEFRTAPPAAIAAQPAPLASHVFALRTQAHQPATTAAPTVAPAVNKPAASVSVASPLPPTTATMSRVVPRIGASKPLASSAAVRTHRAHEHTDSDDSSSTSDDSEQNSVDSPAQNPSKRLADQSLKAQLQKALFASKPQPKKASQPQAAPSSGDDGSSSSLSDDDDDDDEHHPPPPFPPVRKVAAAPVAASDTTMAAAASPPTAATRLQHIDSKISSPIPAAAAPSPHSGIASPAAVLSPSPAAAAVAPAPGSLSGLFAGGLGFGAAAGAASMASGALLVSPPSRARASSSATAAAVGGLVSPGAGSSMTGLAFMSGPAAAGFASAIGGLSRRASFDLAAMGLPSPPPPPPCPPSPAASAVHAPSAGVVLASPPPPPPPPSSSPSSSLLSVPLAVARPASPTTAPPEEDDFNRRTSSRVAPMSARREAAAAVEVATAPVGSRSSSPSPDAVITDATRAAFRLKSHAELVLLATEQAQQIARLQKKLQALQQ